MKLGRSNRRTWLRTGALLGTSGMLSSSRSTHADDAATPGNAPNLKITRVETFLLRHKLKRPFGVSVSVPLDTTREALLVRIETDAGLVGWGESSPINGTRGTIVDALAPLLIGQSPLEHRRLWRQMWGANFGDAIAVACVDMALHDLRGKALGLPVAELYGGRLRDRVPAYASTMNYLEGMEPEDHFPKDALQKVQQGFKALKMRIGRYDVAREASFIRAVRDAVGPDIRLFADGNAAYTLSSALRMGDVLHEQGFEAFEEPLPQSPNYVGYEDLRQKLPLALAGGEAVNSRASAKDLIDRHAMDIIQPDVSLCGGIGEALFIAETAALAGIRCMPHCWGGDIVIAATVQLLALLPDPHWGFPTDTPLLELDQSENPWRNGLAKQHFELEEGMVRVPTAPGLGIEVDEALVRKYAVN